MATFAAYDAVCRSIADLLALEAKKAPLTAGEFKVLCGADFTEGLTVGVSVFLYRATITSSETTLPRRPSPETGLDKSPLMVDLHLLITAWAQDASTEHRICGWMMRTLADHPILSADTLNGPAPNRTRIVDPRHPSPYDEKVFGHDEKVELSTDTVDTAEVLHLWKRISPQPYRLSVPYLARTIRID